MKIWDEKRSEYSWLFRDVHLTLFYFYMTLFGQKGRGYDLEFGMLQGNAGEKNQNCN